MLCTHALLGWSFVALHVYGSIKAGVFLLMFGFVYAAHPSVHVKA
uniref:Uncharacterized protein n=1 Tax=Arundo donax TaxID=35708 RepID=A0A0A9EE56_ARUDO